MDVLCKPMMIKTFVVVRADYWNYICKAGLLRGPLYVATVETRELLTTFFLNRPLSLLLQTISALYMQQ